MRKNLRKAYLKLLSMIGLLTVLACNATFTFGYPTPTVIPPTQSPTATATSEPLISQQVTVVSAPFDETNQGGPFPAYTITSQTPQLTSSTDPRVQAFNQRIGNLIEKEVDQWRQNFQQLPITPLSNGSSLDVKYTLVSQIGDQWSFKFDFAFYADTAAHPGLYSITLNYDLGQGRELALADLFLPNSNYLETISNYCTTELSKQPYADPVFLDGAKPTAENYRNWNITPQGLMITFDTYQVAPGASGPQTVVVPFDQIRQIVDMNGPLKVVLQ